MKKASFYPLLALVLGGVGCVLRRWQMGTEFDEWNLPVPGPATVGLIALTAAGFVLFLLLVLPLKGGSTWEESLGARPLLPLRGGAALFAAAGVLLALALGDQGETLAVFQLTAQVIPFLVVLGALFAAVGLWRTAPGGAVRGRNLVLPALFGCFWTVSTYHNHGTDPVVLHFVWTLFSVCFSALSWYELTALAMGRGHTRRALLLCLMAVMVSLIALAGGESLPDKLLLLAQVVSLLTVSFALGNGLEQKKGKRAAL